MGDYKKIEPEYEKLLKINLKGSVEFYRDKFGKLKMYEWKKWHTTVTITEKVLIKNGIRAVNVKDFFLQRNN